MYFKHSNPLESLQSLKVAGKGPATEMLRNEAICLIDINVNVHAHQSELRSIVLVHYLVNHY